MTERILVVEDAETGALLARVLHAAGYEHVETRESGEGDATGFDLVVLDPRLDGFALLERVAPTGVPVLALTGDEGPVVKRRALGLGAKDFIAKPVDNVELLLRVGNLLHTRRLQKSLGDQVRARTSDLEIARRETLERLALAAEYRDEDTAEHTKRVGRTAALLARGMDLAPETVEHLRNAAPLHDVGKIGLPDAVWLKPGKLTDEEREVLKRHTIIGARILGGSRSPVLRLAEQIAETHHERWDGGGYPRGLVGDAIPLAGRITAVADVFDVLAHPRPHKKAWPVEKAVEEIRDQAGRQFDPNVVAAFCRLDARSLLEPVADVLRRAA
jgi:putative two-component system response regulator